MTWLATSSWPSDRKDAFIIKMWPMLSPAARFPWVVTRDEILIMTFEEIKFSRESSFQRQTVCRQLLWKLLILTFAIKIVKLIQFLLCGRRLGRWICRCVWGISLKPKQHHFVTEVPLKFLKFQWTSVQEVLLNSDELTFECFCSRWLLAKRNTQYFILTR